MKVIVSTLARLSGSVFLLIAYCLPVTAQQIDYAKWVNPFIGTGGHGHTFPGATMPFGMVQLSPDTRTDNWDGSSGYHYSDDVIYGFSHTHLSGTGIPDYCDILLMPTTGQAVLFAKEGDRSVNGYASKFSHANERAEPGYYSVKLDDDAILAEMTATTRVGVHRYTFPRAEEANIVLDLRWRDRVLDHAMNIVGTNRVEGFRRSSSWAKDQVIYFVAEFSKSFSSVDRDYVTVDDARDRTRTMARPLDDRAAFRFRTAAGEQILVKVALSPVSIEGARKNLAAELPGWDFDKVRSDARTAWNKELSKIEVSGGTDAQRTNFYTALYHTMIQPNIFNDVDGNYRGHDGKVHNIADDGTTTPSPEDGATPPKQGGELKRNPKSKIPNPKSEEYTVFSLWDTFRAAHPLYTIIDQRRTVDFINTFIRQYEQGGRLPVWELAGNETDCMIGYHAVSVIADAMAKGIKGFDYEKAYAAAKHSAELDHYGLAAYKRRGYISMEDESESVSRTLEYAYDDWCISQMASILWTNYVGSDPRLRKQRLEDKYVVRLEREEEEYQRRALSYQNLFDPSTGFMRPKKNGGFLSPFAPNEVTFGFTEGNSWQYSFFVPQDVDRLMELMGGREKFVAKLDELFTTDQKLAGREQADLTGLIGQYAHGNEPSHHIAYLYDYAGEPWKTQRLVRKIMDEFYKPQPDGLIGNEDCGQMSAWYVLSASGLYQVTPGEGRYVFGTPLFPEVKYHLENGKTFTIRAAGVTGTNKYIRRAALNGITLEAPVILHEDLMKGGVLDFEMSPSPVADAFKHSPAMTVRSFPTAVPFIGDGRRVFRGSMTVEMRSVTPGSSIFYTTDGSEPTSFSTPYQGPLTVTETTKIRAIAVSAGGGTWSHIAEAIFNRMPNDWSVKVISGYSSQYTGGGENAIVDGIRGTVNFASGEWQGIQGKPYEAVVDLQKETEIKELGASFLQVASPWIWMPANIKFEISNNGSDWTEAASIKTDVPVTDMKPQIREFRQAITPIRARYVRIRAFNIGKIPAWHPGAGGDPWIFIDEIFVQ